MPIEVCPFEVIDEIAAGGMGTVYRAVGSRPPYTGRVVALKRLHPHLARDPHVSQMFVDEARVLAGLRHPSVVEVVAYGADAAGSYIALQYVPGVSLSALMQAAARSRRLLPIGVAIHIAARVAEGLHAAHELRDARGEARHLVHRDVSPQNILVDVEGEVVLVDFGVAKVRDAVAHTRTGVLKGKPAYMSPEQVQGQPIDRRTDVFALGVVLWEMLTLHRLYRGESDIDTLRKILSDPPEPVGGLRQDVPAALDRLLLDALSKTPDGRIASGAEFAARLRDVGEECGGGPHELARFFVELLPQLHATLSTPLVQTRTLGAVLEPSAVTRPRALAPPRRRPLRPVAALAALAAIGLVAALAWRARAAPPVPRAPVVARPVVARPVVARPVVAQPVVARPVVAQPPEIRTVAATAPPPPEPVPQRRARASQPRAHEARAPRGARSLLSRGWDEP